MADKVKGENGVAGNYEKLLDDASSYVASQIVFLQLNQTVS
jgi:hypothetical protein